VEEGSRVLAPVLKLPSPSPAHRKALPAPSLQTPQAFPLACLRWSQPPQ